MPTLLLFLTLLLYPLPAFSACDLRSVEFVRKDVLIFGGGSSGTYAAVKLRDSGKSVMIIESKRTLGGHAETWTDPLTGYTIDAGATVFPPVKRVKDYFSRWGVELSKARAKVDQKYVDFETGIEVNFQPTDTEDFEAALRLYENQLDKHPGLKNGFNLTDPVHPDLLLSFRDFIEKYKLQDLASTIFRINQGLVPLLDVSMLYVFKSLNKDQLLALRNNYLTTSRHNIRALYQKIADFLGPNVLLDTRVIDISRSTDREYDHRVLVNTTKSCRTILAGQLLVTMPPLPNERSTFPLLGRERDLFDKFHAGGYYSAILKKHRT
ncbi:hypothetical protein NUW58_g6524 [Xylaria curta]|uniref:Uncharacterized protein n=1 Tax=Xylaria curta TaxID=42375 RepID=A0ACC1NT45_9PEZI|nr:hypothetical protein NUW58_g6524 [Xylaria curta]